MAKTRKSRVFTVSFPPEMAAQVEQVAEREHRSVSELFRESFREYARARAIRALDAAARYAESLPPSGYGPEDVERLVDEVREEFATQHKRAS